MNLRRVVVTNVITSQAKNHPGEDIRHEKETCFFHIFTGGYMSEPMAIVENKEGNIYQVPLRVMRFLDKAEELK